MRVSFMALAFLQAMIAGCAKQPVVSSDPLNGAWRLAEMRLVLADGRNIPVPAQESLVLFADGYYSICYAFGDSSVPYKKRWRPSGEEKRARFSSMIVNSGSYLLDGDRIDAKPLFALAPEFVNGKGEFSFAFKADTLELTWDKSIAFDGLEYPSQGTVTRLKLVRAN